MTNILKVVQYKKSCPVVAECDVLVVGGGPAGVAAALGAARAGSKVILMEQSGCLGGMGTAGLVPSFIHMTDGVNLLAAGVAKEVVDELARRQKVEPNYGWHNIQPELLKRVYDDLISAAGVELWLATSAVEVVMEGESIKSLIVATRAGLKAVHGQIFVDATGDGNVAAWAGVPFELGNSRGETMSPSLCVLYSGVDWSKQAGSCAGREEWKKLYEAGKAPLQEGHFVGLFRTGEMIGTGNLGHIYGVNAINENEVTHGLVEGRRIAEIYLAFFREHVAGFADAELAATAPILSVRETRRISGDYMLSYDDYQARASFTDEIGRFAYPIDIHASSTDKEAQKRVERELLETRMGKGESYGIPFRCLLPKCLDNVLVAGRCISADRTMQSSTRVMPCCFITGQAAGAAAALAVEKKEAPRNIDPASLRDLLKKQGAYLPELIN